jgi:hypothetical protein
MPRATAGYQTSPVLKVCPSRSFKYGSGVRPRSFSHAVRCAQIGTKIRYQVGLDRILPEREGGWLAALSLPTDPCLSLGAAAKLREAVERDGDHTLGGDGELPDLMSHEV